MTKILKTIVVIIFLYFSYGLYLSRYELNIIPHSLEYSDPVGFYDYSGVINIQTKNSSGSGTIDDVIKAAQDVDLDFIMITDLNQYSHQQNIEKYYNKLLVFNYNKYSFLDSRLFLFDSEAAREITSPGQAQAILSDLLSQDVKGTSDGILLLAHPFKKGFKWQGEYPNGLDGIELINLKAYWQNAWIYSKVSFLWSLLIYPFNPELSFLRLFTMPERELQLWDQLNQKRHTIGFAGADADAKLKFPKNSNLQIPSYETFFSLVQNHVLLESELTGNFSKDREKIITAFKKGQFYVSLDKLANPKGFYAVIKKDDDYIYPIGSHIKLQDHLQLQISIPTKPLFPIDVIVFKDGEKVLSSNSLKTVYPIIEAGNYRVIVRAIPTLPLPDGKKWIPWIFTNTFYVK